MSKKRGAKSVLFLVFLEVLEVANTSPKASKRLQHNTSGNKPYILADSVVVFSLHYHVQPPVTLQKNLKTSSACSDTILKLMLSQGNEHLLHADAHLQCPPLGVWEWDWPGTFPRAPSDVRCTYAKWDQLAKLMWVISQSLSQQFAPLCMTFSQSLYFRNLPNSIWDLWSETYEWVARKYNTHYS